MEYRQTAAAAAAAQYSASNSENCCLLSTLHGIGSILFRTRAKVRGVHEIANGGAGLRHQDTCTETDRHTYIQTDGLTDGLTESV